MGIKQGMNPPLTTYFNKRKKFDNEMSRSSFSSVNSHHVRTLKEHAKVLNKEAFHGNMVSHMVKDKV